MKSIESLKKTEESLVKDTNRGVDPSYLTWIPVIHFMNLNLTLKKLT